MRHYLDFEKPIAELEGKIEELRRMSEPDGINIADEVARLTTVADRQLRATYARLTPWQKTLVARHPDRPKAMDYIAALISDFTPLAGDRAFADDAAVLGGLGRFRGRSVVVLGTEKGADTESRVKHNFGMARPEGYRKARRLIELAGRFGLPVLSFVDTSGAFPGIDAEARGQAEAIARSIEACLEAPVPLVATIIGEGGSGGAIALAAGDRVLMLEHAIYSVISPEGCASILWRDAAQAPAAAEALAADRGGPEAAGAGGSGDPRTARRRAARCGGDHCRGGRRGGRGAAAAGRAGWRHAEGAAAREVPERRPRGTGVVGRAAVGAGIGGRGGRGFRRMARSGCDPAGGISLPAGRSVSGWPARHCCRRCACST